MTLKEYLRKNYINHFNTKDIAGFYKGDSPRRNSNKEYIIEISVDEIENKFPIPKDIVDCPIGEQEVCNNNKFDINHCKLVYKNGKYFPWYDCNMPIFFSYACAAYLKQLRKEHPEVEIPNLICQVYDYELNKEDEIYEKYLKQINNISYSSSYSSFINITSTDQKIFIDKNKMVSCIFEILFINKDGIKIRKIVEKKDREQAKKEIENLGKLKSINYYKEKEYIIAEYDENNELLFFKDKKLIDIDLIYSECIQECKQKYQKNLDSLNKLYGSNKSNVQKYSQMIERINLINRNLDNYEILISNFNGKINLLTKRKKYIKPMDIRIKEDQLLYKNYSDKIDDSILKINEFSPNSLDEIMNQNKNIIELTNYLKYCFDNINKNLIETDKYLKNLEHQQSQIENQSIFNILKNPIKLERNPLVSSISIKKFDSQKGEKDPFMELQKRQAQILTEEEKTKGLRVYKSLLYRPINEIVRSKRINGSITDQVIDNIIKESYEEVKRRLEHSVEKFIGKYDENKDSVGILDELGNVVPYEQFKTIILDAIPLLENSLKAVTIDKPLTVYRSVSTDDINKKEIGFLSTTINSDIALKYQIRPNKGKSVVYKISLPEGSPVNFFSTEICTGKIDEQVGAFNDKDKEIVIDSDNFDFKITNIKTIKDADIQRDNKIIYLVEVDARPKIKLNEELKVR